MASSLHSHNGERDTSLIPLGDTVRKMEIAAWASPLCKKEEGTRRHTQVTTDTTENTGTCDNKYLFNPLVAMKHAEFPTATSPVLKGVKSLSESHRHVVGFSSNVLIMTLSG